MTVTGENIVPRFTIEHILPRAETTTDEDRRKIEEVLFDIFSKYEEPDDTMD